MTPTISYGSCFDGLGAFSLGIARAGLRQQWLVEIDPECRRLTAARFPGVRQFADVKDVGPGVLAPVDLIVAGFPCTDVSHAGKREGLGGARTGLFWELSRIVDGLRPRYLLWENVPGLATSDAGRDLLRVLGALSGLGYSGVYRHLDLRHFGPAQRRRRIFGLFARRDARDGSGLAVAEPWQDERGLLGVLGAVLLDAPGVPGDPAPGRGTRPGDARGAAGGPRGRRGSAGPAEEGAGKPIPFDRLEDDFGSESGSTSPAITAGRGEGRASVAYATHDVSPCLQERGGKGPDSNYTMAPVIDRHQAQPALAFAQNQRNELSDLGDLAGALAAQPGMKQQTYVAHDVAVYDIVSTSQEGRDHAYQAAVTGRLRHEGSCPSDNEAATVVCEAVGFYSTGGSQGVAAGEGVKPPLKVGSGVGAGSSNAVAFHVTQDPINGPIAPAITAGSSEGCGTVGVLTFQERGREGGRNLEISEGVSYALTSPQGGGRSHERNILAPAGDAMIVRRLTPTECGRLQGLPDGHLDIDPPLSDSSKFSMVGNAGGPVICEYIVRRLLAAERQMAEAGRVDAEALPTLDDCEMPRLTYPGCLSR